MTLRLALSSLLARPARSAVLACGFGFGIAVMAALLGVGDVMLEQSVAPALQGGGDLVIDGAAGSVTSARYVMTMLNRRPPFAGRLRAVSPASAARLYLVKDGLATPVLAHGSIPSLDRALGDPETATQTGWTDEPGDAAWSSPSDGDVLRAMDRFHPIPATPLRPQYQGSWAEWIYINGRSSSGSARFYLTFLVGPRTSEGRRAALVRFQIDRGLGTETFSEKAEVAELAVLERAPDLEIGRSRIHLTGTRYAISLDLDSEQGSGRLTAQLSLDPRAGSSIPPFVLRGAGGWISGYTVPVLSGALSGAVQVSGTARAGNKGQMGREARRGSAAQAGGEVVAFDGGTGYHDHNWGFWEGVSWQWGEVSHDGFSIVYGRVRPPADAADPERVPGFLAILGPDGPLGFSTDVTIEETGTPDVLATVDASHPSPSAPDGDSTEAGEPSVGAAPASDPRAPRHIRVRARGAALELTMELVIDDTVTTPVRGRPGDRPSEAHSPEAAPLAFLQLRARYHVTGRIGERVVAFSAAGSAETFRGQ